MFDDAFYIDRELEKEERNEKIDKMKKEFEGRTCKWFRVILTEENLRIYNAVYIEFKCQFTEETNDDMQTHFYYALYDVSMTEAKEIATKMAKLITSAPFNLFIKPRKAQGPEVYLLKDKDGNEIEQGMYLRDKQDNVYFIMGWDEKRVYFVYNGLKDALIGELPNKSLPHHRFNDRF